MRIIPAIDLMDSEVVRLTKGQPQSKKIYSSEALEVAKIWKSQGAKDLHIIDLDKALGRGSNLEVIKEIIRKVKIDTEVGGGIRDYNYAKKLINIGAKRIILSTKVLEDKSFLKRMIRNFKDFLMVSLDIKKNRLAYKGWQATLSLEFPPLIKELQDLGLRWLIYTDILRDGTLKGLNLKEIEKIRKLTSMNLIVSGGVGSLEDLKRIKNLGVWGVIVGKALYEKKFTLKEALSCIGN